MCTYHNIRSFQDAMAMAMLLSNTNAGKYNNMKINLVSKASIEVRYIIIVCPAVLATGKYTTHQMNGALHCGHFDTRFVAMG